MTIFEYNQEDLWKAWIEEVFKLTNNTFKKSDVRQNGVYGLPAELEHLAVLEITK